MILWTFLELCCNEFVKPITTVPYKKEKKTEMEMFFLLFTV
uniref:Uncharacterized protein n=1 Tax=Anguilla anguilla TaxID=7936 RepID=A0A0E9VSH9_ANGAN